MDGIQASLVCEYLALYQAKALKLGRDNYAIEFRYNYIPTDYHWLDLINDLIYMFRGLEDYTARYYPNIADLGIWQCRLQSA